MITKPKVKHTPLLDRLPKVEGKLRAGVVLAKTNWFGVGGPAEVVFRPSGEEDLAHFMAHIADNVPITVVGVGSNLLVRDGGLDGVAIKLGAAFTNIHVEGERLTVGAGALDVHVAQVACEHSLAGLEFLSGIPGGIGGALRMNAGAYGREIADVMVSATAIDPQGKIHTLTVADMDFSYRRCNGVPEGWIFTSAVLQGEVGDKADIQARINEICKARAETQPIKSRTGGSTFKNPEHCKAWELIDAAGCRGLQMGGAQMSEKHCNFMINTGNATAADLENLGEEVRARVKAQSGVDLQWEIRRIGKQEQGK